ncbi:hypothetical protein Tcan_09789 [Toxocara canis]|uniref:Uncharacterized protein n=1 Tax=Toxocara canis TaxID=6265 RepID=A0A0B2VSW5_TOXCA|nr:hypothetical protein Tcan_09789 [Toxocara canis]
MTRAVHSFRCAGITLISLVVRERRTCDFSMKGMGKFGATVPKDWIQLRNPDEVFHCVPLLYFGRPEGRLIVLTNGSTVRKNALTPISILVRPRMPTPDSQSDFRTR